MPSEAINEICAYPGCSCAATDVLWIVTKPKRSVDGTEVSPESSEPMYYDSGWSDDAVDMAVMSTTTRGQSSSYTIQHIHRPPPTTYARRSKIQYS